MTLKQKLAAGIQKLIVREGVPIRVSYFTQTIGSVWDDDISLSVSRTLWTSGIILPLDSRPNSSESILLEQGKLINDDRKLFTHGSLSFTGSEMQVRIQVGSPSGQNYSLLDNNLRVDAQNEPIYRKTFIRQIGNNGSLLGE